MNNTNLTKQFIKNLLEERDFLCWQLTNATGGLTEEQFEEIVTEHFKNRIEKSQEQLNYEAEELVKILDCERIDGDTISTILKCSLDEAEEALKYLTIRGKELIQDVVQSIEKLKEYEMEHKDQIMQNTYTFSLKNE